MVNEQRYARVRHYKEINEFPVEMQRDVLLKNQEVLNRIIPRAILPCPDEQGQDTLYMYYQTSDNQVQRVKVDEINGLNVVTINDPEIGEKLAVKFTYFKSDDDHQSGFKEEEPRKVVVTGVAYGVQSGHVAFGEKSDFYIEGIDVHYPVGKDRLRRFPLWRDGAYGEPEEQKATYLPDKR